MQMSINMLRIKKQARSFYDHLFFSILGSPANTRFIILTSPRSGSNLILNNLRSHRNIHMYNEIYNIFAHSQEELDRVLMNPRSYMEDIFKKKYEPSIDAVGFKFFYTQANEHQLSPDLHLFLGIPSPGDNWRKKVSKTQNYINRNYDTKKIAEGFKEVWTLLKKDTSIKIIHLKRENKLKQFLSFFRASVDDLWVSSGKKISRATPLYLGYNDCLIFFKKYTLFEHEFDNLFSKHNKISISYEDYVKNKKSANEKILNFLNVPLREDLRSGITKQRRKSISESISNYRELKSQFKNSEWEHFFED